MLAGKKDDAAKTLAELEQNGGSPSQSKYGAEPMASGNHLDNQL